MASLCLIPFALRLALLWLPALTVAAWLAAYSNSGSVIGACFVAAGGFTFGAVAGLMERHSRWYARATGERLYR